jgi:hypothetical protein
MDSARRHAGILSNVADVLPSALVLVGLRIDVLRSVPAAPHHGLLTFCEPSILRPWGRPPVVLHSYRCKYRGFKWIRKTDPLEPDRVEWNCFYHASNILTPAAAGSP